MKSGNFGKMNFYDLVFAEKRENWKKAGGFLESREILKNSGGSKSRREQGSKSGRFPPKAGGLVGLQLLGTTSDSIITVTRVLII